MRKLYLLLLATLASPLWAQTGITLKQNNTELTLPHEDSDFIAYRLDQLQLTACRKRKVTKPPAQMYRRLTGSWHGQPVQIDAGFEVMHTSSTVISLPGQDPDTWLEYRDCPQETLLPILAIIATAKVPKATPATDTTSNDNIQLALARRDQLSSLEPSRIGLRWDNDDAFTNKPYLDFTISLKHPLTNYLPLPDSITDASTKLVKTLALQQQAVLVQPFLAFTGRFSQYVGTRESAPVVARTFNPSLFFRFWTTADQWFDLGYAHESNGQSINITSCQLYNTTNKSLIPCAGNSSFDRGTISRGWDYVFATWQGNPMANTQTRVELKQFLRHGLLQTDSEEYHEIEDGGYWLKPRHNYDGMEMSLQYDLDGQYCAFDGFLCARSVELKQQTGLATPFQHNTTIADMTFNIGVVPVQLWARAGYNKDLVDYFGYSRSWGITLKLMTP